VVLIGLFEPQKGKNLKVWNFSLLGVAKRNKPSASLQEGRDGFMGNFIPRNYKCITATFTNSKPNTAPYVTRYFFQEGSQ
jgi:hypothetical protein